MIGSVLVFEKRNSLFQLQDEPADVNINMTVHELHRTAHKLQLDMQLDMMGALGGATVHHPANMPWSSAHTHVHELSASPPSTAVKAVAVVLHFATLDLGAILVVKTSSMGRHCDPLRNTDNGVGGSGDSDHSGPWGLSLHLLFMQTVAILQHLLVLGFKLLYTLAEFLQCHVQGPST